MLQGAVAPFPYAGEVASLGAAMAWAIGLTLYRADTRATGARQVNQFKNLIGSWLFLLTALIVGVSPLSIRDQVYLAVSGVLGLAIGDSLLFKALALLGPHRAALSACLAPVFTGVAGWIFLGEALSLEQCAGIPLVVGGVALVLYGYGAEDAVARAPLKGMLYGTGFAVCHSAGVLLAKEGMYNAGPLAGSALRLTAAAVALVFFSLGRRDLHSGLRPLLRPRSLKRLLPAVLIGTFAGIWMMQAGIKWAPSAVANTLHSTTPLFTLPIAFLVLRERVGPAAVVGSLVAVGGVALLLGAF